MSFWIEVRDVFIQRGLPKGQQDVRSYREVGDTCCEGSKKTRDNWAPNP